MMMPADAPLRQLAQLDARTRRREARREPAKRIDKIIDRLATDSLRDTPAPRGCNQIFWESLGIA